MYVLFVLFHIFSNPRFDFHENLFRLSVMGYYYVNFLSGLIVLLTFLEILVSIGCS